MLHSLALLGIPDPPDFWPGDDDPFGDHSGDNPSPSRGPRGCFGVVAGLILVAMLAGLFAYSLSELMAQAGR